MSSSYHVIFEPDAWSEIMQLPESLQLRILAATESLENNPRPSGSKKLKDEAGLHRIRVGDYRIVYRVEDDVLTVLVVRVGNRRDVYKKRK